MKIVLVKDMAALRGRAKAALDEHYRRRYADATAMDGLRAAKVAEAFADDQTDAPLLAAEAEARRTTVQALAATVRDNAVASRAAVAQMERERQGIAADIAAAANTSDLAAALARAGLSIEM